MQVEEYYDYKIRCKIVGRIQDKKSKSRQYIGSGIPIDSGTTTDLDCIYIYRVTKRIVGAQRDACQDLAQKSDHRIFLSTLRREAGLPNTIRQSQTIPYGYPPEKRRDFLISILDYEQYRQYHLFKQKQTRS